jgi:predicted KAP-like P-loop ATPase
MKWPFRRKPNNRTTAADQRSEEQVEAQHKSGITGDNPIRRKEDDTIGRAVLAQSFAQQVLSLDWRAGVVVGVLGEWGFGKTSFINLVRVELEQADIPVLDFNPWMFSGAEQLVESFFIELAAQLRLRSDLADVGKALEDYGEMFSGMSWVPLIGPWIEGGRVASQLLGKLLQRRKEGIGGRRAKLEKSLASLHTPIVVVLDDIDRLSTPEIRDIFKLVRLTASFPNIVYIVSFDRARVEQALAEQGVPGRAYLEKILQVTVDLPAVPQHMLTRQVLTALDAALAGSTISGPFNEQLWPDIFMEVIRPLIRNMRDVRRYAATIPGTVSSLNGQVELVDVLALEAIRVFLPEVFQNLHSSVDGLTTTSSLSYGYTREPPHLKEQVDTILEKAGPHTKVVRSLIERLFPAAQRYIGQSHYGEEWGRRWLRERRVAHAELLRLYLERVAGEGLQSFTDAEQAWSKLGDGAALDIFLRSLDLERLQDVIASLEVFEDQFTPEHVVPATTVLLNLLPDLPERPRTMFWFGTDLTVTRVTYRLLRSLNNPPLVEEAVRQILPQLRHLSAKHELISDIGYSEGAGHKLVSEEAAAVFEKALRDEIREATDDKLVKEKHLLRLLLFVKRGAEPGEEPLTISSSPDIALALLRSARSDTVSQTMGSRAIRRSPRLAWEVLVELYGDETSLGEQIDRIKSTKPDADAALIELAERYRAGWRPERF